MPVGSVPRPGAPSEAPHSEQNFAAAGNSALQRGQRMANAAPHSKQNLARSGFSCPQDAQTTVNDRPAESASLTGGGLLEGVGVLLAHSRTLPRQRETP